MTALDQWGTRIPETYAAECWSGKKRKKDCVLDIVQILSAISVLFCFCLSASAKYCWGWNNMWSDDGSTGTLAFAA
jgi:hypothetical protein